MVDGEIKRFVDEYVDSLVSWAIIVFYHENPGARDRVEDLALHLGRRLEDVRWAAEALSEKGLLKKIGDGKEVVYVYEPEEELRTKVERFVQSLDNRQVRLAVLSGVLDKGLAKKQGKL